MGRTVKVTQWGSTGGKVWYVWLPCIHNRWALALVWISRLLKWTCWIAYKFLPKKLV